MAWFTGFCMSRSAALLSICKGVAWNRPSRSSNSSHWSQTSSFDTSVAAMYSAWVDDIATMLCCFDIQDMAPPEYKNAYPDTD